MTRAYQGPVEGRPGAGYRGAEDAPLTARRPVFGPAWGLGLVLVASPALAETSGARENTLRFLATTAGFDEVSVGVRPASGSPDGQAGPEHHTVTHNSVAPPEDAPGGGQGPLLDGEPGPEPSTAWPGVEAPEPSAPWPAVEAPEPEVGPEGELVVHSEMPAGAEGGPEHAPLELLLGEDFVPDSPAFVLTFIAEHGALEGPPTIRIGDVLFSLADDGEPPDLVAGDLRWAAVLERYPTEVPLQVLDGLEVLGELPLSLDEGGSHPGLALRLTAEGLTAEVTAGDGVPGAPTPPSAAPQAAQSAPGRVPWGWLAAAALAGVTAVAAFGLPGTGRRRRRRR